MVQPPETPNIRREDRWQNLVHGAFLLDEGLASTSEEERLHCASAMLDSFLEVFPSSVDPVDDFEGYAVRRLLLSLRRALPK
jgi:hypothetical protein